MKLKLFIATILVGFWVNTALANNFILQTHPAQSSVSHSVYSYKKALDAKVAENQDFDFGSIGTYFSPQFQEFTIMDINNYPSNGIEFSPYSLSKQKIHETMNKHIDEFIGEWNRHTGLYGNYFATCDKIYWELDKFWPMIGGNMLMELDNNSIRLNKEEYINIIACYIKDKHKVSQEIKTGLAAYRKHNIGTALRQFDNKVWANGENLAMYENIFNGKAKYVNGYALRVNGQRVEEFSVYGGGTCGVSSIYYQNALKTYGVDIVKRQAHSNFYKSYYGNTIGLDATIFGSSNGKASVDLVMKNNTGINIFMTTYDYASKRNYIYGVNFYAPFIQQNKIKQENEVVKGKNCYRNTITDPTGKSRYITSCYKNVY